MIKIQGTPSQQFSMVVGEAITSDTPFYKRHSKIIMSDAIGLKHLGYLAILSTTNPINSRYLPPIIGGIQKTDISQIKNGDIISVNDCGEISILWEMHSQQNSLLLTEACNCACVMCPQPPKKHDQALIDVAMRVLRLLRNKPIDNICLTGGEPTLPQDEFLAILRECSYGHPNAQLYILTNAKQFSIKEFAEKASMYGSNATFCVSLHSDINSIHDRIVNASDSYAKTQDGIYNLAKYRMAIEIRHVVTRYNYDRLLEFSDHLYRYFPFCVHYAFMAMEICGLADINVDAVYIEPVEYIELLRKAVLALHKKRLPVSIYNIPLCLCQKDIRKFCRMSISSWKKTYLDICHECFEKENCCGFFSTSSKLSIRGIEPIKQF